MVWEKTLSELLLRSPVPAGAAAPCSVPGGPLCSTMLGSERTSLSPAPLLHLRRLQHHARSRDNLADKVYEDHL